MSIETNYPVFQPDQVLTNRHLNDVVDYLDQQNRLTRTKLIGSGIVCGLDIEQGGSVISISKGCALTSQGFMILLPCENVYKYYIPYTPPVFPNDLHFILQCDKSKTDIVPFYTDPFNKDLLELIGETDYNGLDADTKGKAIGLSQSPAGFLDDYVIVLFFEADEMNLKNCDTNDCNDKGSRMDFEVRVLLVKKQRLDQIKRNDAGISVLPGLPPVLALKRYNVPAQKLSSSADVLNAFKDITDDSTIKALGEALRDCAARYSYLLADPTDKPFETVASDLVALRDSILKNTPILIQYFYDYIDDLIKSYAEFLRKAFHLNTECCMNEMRFPLHVMLGEASLNTKDTSFSAYREYFIYSPLFNAQQEKLSEVRLLFARLKLLIREFSIDNMLGFDKKEIRLTPSRYGMAPLSDRCIPYYYKEAEAQNELYQSWSYGKTNRGLASSNLGYFASDYSAAAPVVHPLEYDIEPYNFFRIEGHIGKPVFNALTTVESEKEKYNLPFGTVALSADYIGALLQGQEPVCMIQDLESDYRLVVAELICTLHDAFCSLYQFNFKPMSSLAVAALAPATVARAAVKATAVPDENEEEVKILMSNVDLSAKIGEADISSLVGEYQFTQAYTKGTLLQKLCGLKTGSIGASYISNISMSRGVFVNPVTLNTPVKAAVFYNGTFELIDAIESMFLILMNNQLAALDMDVFRKAYSRYETDVRNLYKILTQVTNKVEVFLNTCIVTKLEALKNEYLRRTAQYRLERNFGYYFTKHGGVEHKAGVTRGGTFILVYHEERRNRFIDPNSIFVNSQLSTLMLKNFTRLLQPATKVDDLEFQTRLIQTATLYKEPELYLRFKEVLQKYVDECADLPDDRRNELVSIINLPPVKENFKLEDGMVIADFFVPYLCCSDCAPIAYVLPPPPKDDTADPTIKIDKNRFCNNDTNRYPVMVQPAGGVISGTGVTIDASGKYGFSPAGLSAGLYTLTYKTNNKTASVNVEVVATPKPKFSVRTSVNAGLMTVNFSNESTDTNDQTMYEWQKDGVKFSDKKDPDPIKFKVSSLPHTFLLKESNGECPAESDPVTLELTTRKLSVCSNVKDLPLETGLPANATVSILINEGNILDEKLVLHPSALSATQSTTLNVSYTVNGKQTNVTVLVVVANADFTMQLTRAVGTTNVPPLMLILKSLGTGFNKSSWLLQQDTIKITNVTEGTPMALQQLGFKPDLPIVISHHVEINTDSEVCAGDKKFELTRQIMEIRLNKGPFDNNNQP